MKSVNTYGNQENISETSVENVMEELDFLISEFSDFQQRRMNLEQGLVEPHIVIKRNTHHQTI